MVEFDEIAIRNEFMDCLREFFAEQYNLLKTEVEVTESESQEPSFPCVIVSILNPVSAERYSDSGGTYQFIDFSVNCECYSNGLDDFNLEDSVIKLSQLTITGILNKYKNFVVTRNNAVPFRADVKRRTVTLRGTYDNRNKIIYSN